MSLASQVEGFSDSPTWPDLKLAAFLPSGPQWQMWLEHLANYYMPPTIAYMFACWEVRQLLTKGRQFPRGTPVSSANKTDCLDMTRFEWSNSSRNRGIAEKERMEIFTMRNILQQQCHIAIITCMYSKTLLGLVVERRIKYLAQRHNQFLQLRINDSTPQSSDWNSTHLRNWFRPVYLSFDQSVILILNECNLRGASVISNKNL